MRSLLVKRPQTALIVVGALMALTLNSGAIILGATTKTWSENETKRELNSLAQTLGEQTNQAFIGLQLVQDSLIAQIESAVEQGVPEFDKIATSYQLHQSLKDRIKGLPHINAITVVDATGRLKNFSRYWPIPAVSIADREYFTVFTSDPKIKSYISVPVQNRGDGRWTVYVARKVLGRDGAFLGLVLAALDLEYFEKFYEAVSFGAGSAISLLRLDGTFLARYPQIDRSTPRIVTGRTPFFAEILANSGHGTARQHSPLDGAERFVSGRQARDYPVVVSVSTLVDRALAPWRRAMMVLASIMLFLDTLLATAVLLGLRQIRAHGLTTYISRHDALTGLPNRLLLREWIDAARTSGDDFCLALIDLDRFKLVNDMFGHATGDALLKRTGSILREMVGSAGIVARLGGDEFAVVWRTDQAEELCHRILASFRTPLDLDGRIVSTSASIGISSAPRDGSRQEDLLRKADIALYEVKNAGRDGSRHFDETMERAIFEAQFIENGLQSAVERDELRLYLQPIIDLNSGEPSGFEALLRWQCPKRGFISPVDFIPVAERSGLIVPIGEWVLRQACREAALWRDPYCVSVNLSPMQFDCRNLVDAVKSALVDADLRPSRLELEITESVFLQKNDTVLDTLRALRALGVRIALDDFGTGYSSLGYLTSFPFDRLKIDRSFVRDLPANTRSLSVIHATVGLANSLGLALTVEGVETEEQLRIVRESGVNAVQGFYFSRPKPAHEIAAEYGWPDAA